jgi:hypothetical protein
MTKSINGHSTELELRHETNDALRTLNEREEPATPVCAGANRKRMKSITCKTQWHIIVAWLWSLNGQWVATYECQSRETDFGFIGSSGEQRVRELARNAPGIPEDLRDKVEKKRDGKYEYFRYVPKNVQMCRRFDAGLPAQEVFAV